MKLKKQILQIELKTAKPSSLDFNFNPNLSNKEFIDFGKIKHQILYK